MSEWTRRTFSQLGVKPSDSLGLEQNYESLVRSCNQNPMAKTESYKELTKTQYLSSFWRNWNASRSEITVKINKLDKLHRELASKERNFRQHYEETRGRNFDEDYFVLDVKNEIENLDRWYYDNKHFMDANVFKDKDDLSGAQTIQRQEKNERLQIPDLDVRMLDLIMQDGNEIVDMKESEMETEKRTGISAGPKIARAEDQKKHDYNKQLLLELIIKKLSKEEKVYYSKTHLHSAIKLLIQDTMGRFRTMKTLYGNANFLNDYDRLYELVAGKEMDRNRTIEKELATLKKSNRLDYKRYESLVKGKYIECQHEIDSRKEQIETLRRLNNQRQMMTEERQKYYRHEIEMAKKEEERIHEDNKYRITKKNIRTVNKEALRLEDFMLITKIEQKISDLKKKEREEGMAALEENDRTNTEIKRIENEIVDFKMKRVIFKYRLKECYVNILKSPKEIM